MTSKCHVTRASVASQISCGYGTMLSKNRTREAIRQWLPLPNCLISGKNRQSREPIHYSPVKQLYCRCQVKHNPSGLGMFHSINQTRWQSYFVITGAQYFYWGHQMWPQDGCEMHAFVINVSWLSRETCRCKNGHCTRFIWLFISIHTTKLYLQISTENYRKIQLKYEMQCITFILLLCLCNTMFIIILVHGLD